MTAEELLQALADKAEIADVMHRYATGLDARDWELYRNVFTDVFENYTATGEWERVTADDWVERWRPVFEGYDATQHFMGNHRYDLRGDEATCTTYVRARHVIVENDEVRYHELGGYYTCELVRTSAGWKMSRRRLTATWRDGVRGGLNDEARRRGQLRLSQRS
jgi:hypothetical protein